MLKIVYLNRLKLLGIYLLISVIANQTINYVNFHSLIGVLWYCDMTALLLGISLLFNNRTMATVSLVTAVPAQFLWIIDFFLQFFNRGFGRTEELFSYGSWVFWFSTNLHASLIPISLFAVWQLGFDRLAIKSVLFYMGSLTTITFVFTDYASNINCVFFSCDQKFQLNDFAGYAKYFVFNILLCWQIISAISFFVFRFIFQWKERTYGPRC